MTGIPRLNPGMKGTQEMLDSIEKCPTIQCLVLTSSMSACAPTPEPPLKDESHWSDDNAQLSRGNYYGCLSKFSLFFVHMMYKNLHLHLLSLRTETRQEKLCHEWVKNQSDKGRNIKFSAICPTMVLGPPVGADQPGYSYNPSGTSTMNSLLRWLTGGRPSAPNDSMSFIHVRDCAAMHVAAMENTNASARYFSLVESWHWNDILTTLKELYPDIPLNTPFKYEGRDIITPTQFDLDRMNSLGVNVIPMKDILAESTKFFRDVGALK